MLGQNDKADDVTGGAARHIGDLAKARDVGVHVLLAAPHEVAIGAEALGERLAVDRVRLTGDRGGKRASRREQRKTSANEHEWFHGASSQGAHSYSECPPLYRQEHPADRAATEALKPPWP